jgi:PIN domain nuclease of toxin-antitoxin system
MSDVILDASAILAVLNQEPGAELVQKHLARARISAVNLAEVITRLNLMGMPTDQILEVMSLLSLDVVPFDEEQAIQAGILARETKSAGLSLGDRACLALGILTGSSVLTADLAWQQIPLPIEVIGIRGD